MTTRNCSCCFSFRRSSLRKIESSPRDSQCKETCCCWFRRLGARSSPSANNSTIESSPGDSQCKETPLSSATLFERISKTIESKGKSPLSREYPKHAVGIDKSISEVLDLLEIESAKNAVTVILHGFGGMGKTTLADEVFSHVEGCKYSKVQLCRHFGSNPDIIDLQKLILEDLMGPEEPVPDIGKHEDGQRELERVLEKVQAFLYIDNVLDGDALKKLLPQDMGTAKNVRVLLTARDQNVKKACPRSSTETKIYKMNGVHDQEAMLILKKEIEEGSITDSQFNDIIEICGKIPLMLTLAAEFIGRENNKQEAFSTLMQQKDTWEDFSAMRYTFDFAYDDLPDECKDPFLDICSYFKGWDWETVADMVGKDELTMLESRAFVTQTTGGGSRISVHQIAPDSPESGRPILL